MIIVIVIIIIIIITKKKSKGLKKTFVQTPELLLFIKLDSSAVGCYNLNTKLNLMFKYLLFSF